MSNRGQPKTSHFVKTSIVFKVKQYQKRYNESGRKAWLRLTKQNYTACNLREFLSEWNFSNNSLSSSFIQKILDGFRVFYIYQKFSFLKSLFYLFNLSIKSLKRKF